MPYTVMIMADDHVVSIDYEDVISSAKQCARTQVMHHSGDRALVWDDNDTIVLDYEPPVSRR